MSIGPDEKILPKLGAIRQFCREHLAEYLETTARHRLTAQFPADSQRACSWHFPSLSHESRRRPLPNWRGSRFHIEPRLRATSRRATSRDRQEAVRKQMEEMPGGDAQRSRAERFPCWPNGSRRIRPRTASRIPHSACGRSMTPPRSPSPPASAAGQSRFPPPIQPFSPMPLPGKGHPRRRIRPGIHPSSRG